MTEPRTPKAKRNRLPPSNATTAIHIEMSARSEIPLGKIRAVAQLSDGERELAVARFDGKGSTPHVVIRIHKKVTVADVAIIANTLRAFQDQVRTYSCAVLRV